MIRLVESPRRNGKSTLMKQLVANHKDKPLTQAIFKYAPAWVSSATIERNGDVWWHECEIGNLCLRGPDDQRWWGPKQLLIGLKCWKAGSGYNADDFQNSAIARDLST